MFRKTYLSGWVVLFFSLSTSLLQAQNVSFVVAADNRNFVEQFREVLREINDMSVNPEPAILRPSFFVSCGDIDPVPSNMAIQNDTLTYPNLPLFYPVVGNHEFETQSDMDHILNVLNPNLENVVNKGKQGTYSFDYANVHCIVLDQYSTNGQGEIDSNLQAWLQNDLNTTTQDHIFLYGHEPAFPRHRHLGDALNQFPESRNDFWNMLVKDPRVRIFFCGHTHYYYRMQVVDPASVGSTGLPNQEGGVYQVDVGAIGNFLGDGKLTLIYAQVEEDSIRLRTIQTPRENTQWSLTEDWTIPGTKRFSAELTTPQAESEVAGLVDINWTVSDGLSATGTSILYISKDAGAHWDTLWTGPSSEITHAWDTANFTDGTRYMLRLVSENSEGFGFTQTGGTFTINNPGNAAPEIELLTPAEGELIKGDRLINWYAGDADSDPLTFSMVYSVDNGFSWKSEFSGLQNITEYVWNTPLLKNSPNYKIILRCTDGIIETADTSAVFEIFNERQSIPSSQISHASGSGGAIISAQYADANQLTGNLYRITFDDTLFSRTVYSVDNINSGERLVENATEIDGVTEGPFFDGIRLIIKDFDPPESDLENTGWAVGASTLDFSITVPTVFIGGELRTAVPHPSDYKITLFDEVVDSSTAAFGIPPKPLKFTVWNLTDDRKADFLFTEFDGNQTISDLDKVTIIEPDAQGELQIAWSIFFTGSRNHIAPVPGDEFLFRTLKPIKSEDIFELKASLVTSVSTRKSKTLPLTMTLYPNYPNPFNPSTTISYFLPKSQKIIVAVYNLRGQKVVNLWRGNQRAGRHSVTWDGRDKLGAMVSSGLYIYRIDGRSISKSAKMMFLK